MKYAYNLYAYIMKQHIDILIMFMMENNGILHEFGLH